MDSCNTAHEVPKAACSLSAKATAARTTGAHPQGRAHTGAGVPGGGLLGGRGGGAEPKGESCHAEPGRPAIYIE